MKRALFILLFSWIPLSLQAPIPASEDDKTGASDPKKPRSSCYFSVPRFSEMELPPERIPKLTVEPDCEGEMTSLTSLAKETQDLKYGATSQLDVLLQRGAAHYIAPDKLQEWEGIFVCKRHFEQLVSKWSKNAPKRIRKSGSQVQGCAFPQIGHNAQLNDANKYEISREDARIYLEQRSVHLPMGLPICRSHNDEVKLAVKEYNEQKCDVDVPQAPPMTCYMFSDSSDSDDGETCTGRSEEEEKFAAYCKAINVNRAASPRLKFSELAVSSRKKKIQSFRKLVRKSADMIAPGEGQSLIACLQTSSPSTYGDAVTDQHASMLRELNLQFLDAPNVQKRDEVLSIAATSHTFAQLQEFFPGISHSKYYRARKRGLGHKPLPARSSILERYCPEKVELFVTYITCPQHMIELPYGTRMMKMTDGTRIEIPNVVIQYGIAETIRRFKNYLEDEGKISMAMGDSTMFKLLSAMPVTRRHQMTCVDSFVEAAHYAFEDLIATLDRLRELTLISVDDYNNLRLRVLEMKFYLKGDFRLALKKVSRIADHDLIFALSDPTDADFALPGTVHDLQCARCNNIILTTREFATLLARLKNEAQSMKADSLKELREMEFRAKNDVESIQQLKMHEARAKFTMIERERLIASLQKGDALITLDYAQKFLPAWHCESQKVFYGKTGLSWHISHVLANVSGQYVEHNFIHLLNYDTQDSFAVTAIIRHMLNELAHHGVKRVHLRSDNAGCYHSANTLGNIPSLNEEALKKSQHGDHNSDLGKIAVASWSFSEAQSGKSSSDRVGAVAKSKMRSYLFSGKDIRNVDQMFLALTAKPAMKGTSVHKVNVRKPTTEPKKSVIARIKDYGHFQYTDAGVRAWKYFSIGVGKLLDASKMFDQRTTLEELEEGGNTRIASRKGWEENNIENGREGLYWHWRPDRIGEYEPDDFDDDIADDNGRGSDTRAMTSDALHYCWCGASYIRYGNLENHMSFGTHKVKPEKTTLRDFTLGLFKKGIEEVQCQSSLFCNKDQDDESIDTTIPILNQGWSLRGRKLNRPLSPKAKAFVEAYVKETQKAPDGRSDPEEAFKKQNADDTIKPEERMSLDQMKSLVQRLLRASKRADDADGENGGKTTRRKRSDTTQEEEDQANDEEYEDLFEWDEDACPLLSKPDNEIETIVYEEDHYPTRYFHEHAATFFESPESPSC